MTAVKLWIDDLRPAPGDGWVTAEDSASALEFLAAFDGTLAEVSFDHDLGGDDTTRPVMMWLIEHEMWPARIFVHTANPVGRDWLVGTAQRYAPETTRIVW